MKKVIIFSLLLFIFFFIIIETPSKEKEKKEETKAVFVSYIELNNYLKDLDEKSSKKSIDKMIYNIKKMKLNTIILQVRTSQDAIYKSKIFPVSKYLSSNNKINYDVLAYFIKKSHENNLKLYAWINPYRISTTSNIDETSPAYKYLNTDTIYINNGVYYNPSKEEVTNIIIDGVKEVLNYDVDAVMFDDYFYPSPDVDTKDYEEYLKNNPYIDFDTYHLNVINNMVLKVHKTCHEKGVKFGISPDGNIENNYNKNFADVRKWLSSNEYVDFIMPQIYYGFYNSTKDYVNVTKEWEELLKNKNIKLLVALAFYKIGIEDNYAKEGRDEWILNDNIIMKEIIISRNLKNYQGFALFRYENIFNTAIYTSNSINEIENMKKVIK